MSENVVTLRQAFAPDDIATTLRRIADEFEKGEFGLMTTCLVVMGHSGDRQREDGVKVQSERYELFGCGPRCDMFTTRGLLLTVATQPLDGGQ